MNTRNTIQKFLGYVMLIIFTFSITPKKLLHDALSDHTDMAYGLVKAEKSVAKKTINCHCDHQVVESPFTEQAIRLDIPAPPVVRAAPAIHYLAPLYKIQILKENKGPPAFIS